MELFFAALVPVFFAELGDKTQLAALALASGQGTRGKWVVFLGSALALSFCSLVAALLGGFLGDFLANPAPIRIAAGVLFIAFGALMLRDDGEVDEVGSHKMSGSFVGQIARVFAMIAIAETGDKTQLTTLGLAGPSGQGWWIVLLGSASALIAISAISVLASNLVDRILPPKRLKILSIGIFFVLGLVYLVQGLCECIAP